MRQASRGFRADRSWAVKGSSQICRERATFLRVGPGCADLPRNRVPQCLLGGKPGSVAARSLSVVGNCRRGLVISTTALIFSDMSVNHIAPPSADTAAQVRVSGLVSANLDPRLEPTGPDRDGRELSHVVVPFYAFDSYRLIPNQRLLLEGDSPIRLGSRAFDILLALLERPGELVSKKELIARVWPNTFVDSGNLKFQIAAVRRALGDRRNGRRYLDTSPGQGYRFVAPVAVVDDAASLEPQLARLTEKNNMPRQITRLFGRADLIAKLADYRTMRRLLTIVGPGGIGKTSVALAVAERLRGAYDDGVWLVDLAAVADPKLVGSAIARALGYQVNPERLPTDLIASLCKKQLLLILNDCAHVIDAVASLVVDILRGAPGIQICATSREPLHVEGEHVHRLAPLETPPASEQLSAADALRYPAVQMFVEQIGANVSEFELRDEDAPVVARICRMLDGIPLAIEFAAGRAGMLGVRGLAARLGERLDVLSGGRRTGLARHRTMRAALDWSYGLLSTSEQAVFRRLGIFSGGFTLAAAAAVAEDRDQSEDRIVGHVLGLAEKSLVVTDVDGAQPRFRLLHTTRIYALEKLAETGEREQTAQRHADCCRAHPSGIVHARQSED